MATPAPPDAAQLEQQLHASLNGMGMTTRAKSARHQISRANPESAINAPRKNPPARPKAPLSEPIPLKTAKAKPDPVQAMLETLIRKIEMIQVSNTKLHEVVTELREANTRLREANTQLEDKVSNWGKPLCSSQAHHPLRGQQWCQAHPRIQRPTLQQHHPRLWLQCQQ